MRIEFGATAEALRELRAARQSYKRRALGPQYRTSIAGRESEEARRSRGPGC